MKFIGKIILSIFVCGILFFIWQYKPPVKSTAVVVEPMQLATCRFQYAQAEAQLKELAAHLYASSKEYNRLKMLHDEENIVSEKRVEQAYALWQRDRAKWQAATASFQYQNECLELQWGGEIAYLIRDGGDLYKEIVSQNRKLIQVHAPASLANQPQTLYMQAKNGKFFAAKRFSRHGQLLFYCAQDKELNLPPGSSLVAHFEMQETGDGAQRLAYE